MYCLSKKEFQRDRIKILILGLIIGLSVGICAGFLWGTITVENIIRTTVIQIPQQVDAIPF